VAQSLGTYDQPRCATNHRTELRLLGAVAVLALAGTALAAFTGLPGLPCLFRLVFHFPCPGCGLTRSFTALWHGDFAHSLRFHPLGSLLFLLAIVMAVRLLTPRSSSARAKLDGVLRQVMRARILKGVFAVMIALWLVRLGLMLAGDSTFVW
jgi:hypothetical protein